MVISRREIFASLPAALSEQAARNQPTAERCCPDQISASASTASAATGFQLAPSSSASEGNGWSRNSSQASERRRRERHSSTHPDCWRPSQGS